MTIQLEEMMKVPGRYGEICVNKDRIIGSRITFGREDYLLDLLTPDGTMIKQFGKDHSRSFLSQKVLYKNLNPFDRGDTTIFTILGYFATFIPQLVYNIATIPIEALNRNLFQNSPKDIGYPISIDCSEDRIYALNFCQFPSRRGEYSANIAIFDMQGNLLKKVTKTGAKEGEIAIDYLSRNASIRVKDGSLYLLDSAFGIRIQEFDLKGNFKRTVLNPETSGIQHHSINHYCDFSVGRDEFYVVLYSHEERGEWDKLARIDRDGRTEIFDLSKEVGLINGVAVGDRNVYVSDGRRINTYDKNMKLISKDSIPGIDKDDLLSITSDSHRLVFSEGSLYLPMNDWGCTQHNLDGTIEYRQPENNIARMRVE